MPVTMKVREARLAREGGQHITWEEKYLGPIRGESWLKRLAWYLLYLALAALLLFALAVAVAGARNIYPDLGFAFRIATAAFALIVLVAIGCRMAVKISPKKKLPDQSGLIAPSDLANENLWGKWLETIRRSRRGVAALVMLFLITCTYINVNPLAWIVLPLIFLAQVWLIGNVGLFLSLRARFTGQAVWILLCALLAIIAIALILSRSGFSFDLEEDAEDRFFRFHRLYQLDRFEFLGDHRYPDIDDWANPPQSWWHLLRENDPRYFARHLPRECTDYGIAIFLYCLVGTYFLLFSTRSVPRPMTNKS